MALIHRCWSYARSIGLVTTQLALTPWPSPWRFYLSRSISSLGGSRSIVLRFGSLAEPKHVQNIWRVLPFSCSCIRHSDIPYVALRHFAALQLMVLLYNFTRSNNSPKAEPNLTLAECWSYRVFSIRVTAFSNNYLTFSMGLGWYGGEMGASMRANRTQAGASEGNTAQ